MAKDRKVAAYVRVSTDEQAEQGLSIDTQKSRLLAYCQSRGWQIYDFYIDDGYSGKDLGRPGIARLLRDIEENRIDTVLVLKLDRLSRRQKDILYLLEDIFEPNKVDFKSVTENFDTGSGFGKAALSMMAVFAQLERETIQERTRMGKMEAARKGRWHGGNVYGYYYKPGSYVLQIKEPEAGIVKKIYDLYLEGHGVKLIADTLNNKNIPGPSGGQWTKQTVRYMLSNPTYAGYSRHKEKYYRGMHPAIIPPEKWYKVQELLKQRKSRRNLSATGALLSGVIYCAECGARARSKSVWQNHPRRPKRIRQYYVCYSQDGTSRYLVRDPNCRCGYKRKEEIEKKVITQLQNYDFEETLLQMQVNEEIKAIENKEKNALQRAGKMKKELQQVDGALNRWYEAFEKGELDPREFTGRVENLRRKRKNLEDAINELESKLQNQKHTITDKEKLISLLKNFNLIWKHADQKERKQIINGLVRAVYIHKNGQVKVEFNSWDSPISL